MVVNGFLSALSLAPRSRLKRRQNIVPIKNQTDLLRIIVFDEKMMKCSSRSLQVVIQSGLFNDWTSAMPSTIATVTSLLPMELVLHSPLCFSRMCINVLLQEQCIIVPSEVSRYLGTTVNS